ncbi:MAG: tRNA (adenosine(37)-N6)-threonylcarbamoyltransferase complex dimerization subunit type 1 TsaB [bacterium]|nr:tRNA (adenosine(37)-N6)-threonylcarbamoyltransferase complex dimerization subunit type 1 TsaB [bacterium]
MKKKKIIKKKIWKTIDASKEILPAIDKLLNSVGMKSEMFDYFIVSSGPGSWTGIRLGLSVAYGLSIACDRKVFGVSSLESIAYKFKKTTNVGVILPSTGEFVHYGIFENPESLEKKLVEIHSCRINEISSKMKKATIIASPSKKILSVFNNQGKRLVRVTPDPVLNARLALERIKNSVNPRNQPYYEK